MWRRPIRRRIPHGRIGETWAPSRMPAEPPNPAYQRAFPAAVVSMTIQRHLPRSGAGGVLLSPSAQPRARGPYPPPRLLSLVHEQQDSLLLTLRACVIDNAVSAVYAACPPRAGGGWVL